MKILIVTTEFPPFPGGIATYAYNMALSSKSLGHNVQVIAPNYGLINIDDSLDVSRYSGHSYNKKDLFKIIFNIYKAYKTNSYDIVHAIDWPSVLAVYIFKIFKKLDFITTIYGTDIFVYKHSKAFKLFNPLKVLNSTKSIITISQFTTSLLRSNFPNLSANIYCSYLGINNDFYNNVKEVDIIGKYNLPNKKIVLSVSRLDERKGHIDTINALNKLPIGLQDEIIYVVIGKKVDDSYYDKLMNEINNSNVSCYYLGAIDFDDLLTFYTKSYIFCMPGKQDDQKVEGFGLVYLEAATKRLPSLAYSLSAVPEVVKHEFTGLLCKEGDINELSQNIKKLILDEEYKNLLGENAYSYSKKFTWEKCAKDTYIR